MRNIQLLAHDYWKQYSLIFPKLIRFKCPDITLSNRLTATAGYNRSEQNLIVLSNKHLAKFPDTMLNTTLPHELAHQIDYNLYGWELGEKHHRKSWQEIMVMIDQIPNIYHDMGRV